MIPLRALPQDRFELMIPAKTGSQEAREAKSESRLLYNGADAERIQSRNSMSHKQHTAPAGLVCHVGDIELILVDPTAKDGNVFLDRGGTDMPATVILVWAIAFTSRQGLKRMTPIH
jgi:hypothetical protein